jgi:hypothetical protein
MSKALSNSQHARVQKVCMLWTHDDNFSREDIVFNGEKFPELPTEPGSLLQIVAIHADEAVRDFHTGPKSAQNDMQTHPESVAKHPSTDAYQKRTRRGSIAVTIDENGSAIPAGREFDTEKAYVFVSKALPADLKSKYANLQVRYIAFATLQNEPATGAWELRNTKMR